MKNLVCSIYNKDTSEFGALMLFPSKKVAESQFLAWLDKSKNENKYFDADDLELHIFANFDSSDAKITTMAKKIVIVGSKE